MYSLKGLFLLLVFSFCLPVGAIQLKIIANDGKPISNANIYVTPQGQETPFHYISNDKGLTNVSKFSKGVKNLKVLAFGYENLDIDIENLQDPVEVTLSRSRSKSSAVQISGKTTSYKNLKRDGWIDVGIVIRGLNRSEVVALNPSELISPVSDKVSILGYDFEVPSNISIPKQKESYVFSFTLNKPEYKAFVPKGNKVSLAVLHAKAPVKKLADDFQNGTSYFDMVKHLKFVGGGKKVVPTKVNKKNVHLSVTNYSFKKVVNVKAPFVSRNKAMLAISLFEERGKYFVTDMKKVESRKAASMLGRPNKKPLVIAALFNDNKKSSPLMDIGFNPLIFASVSRTGYDFEQISYFVGVGKSVSPSFMTMIQSPSYNKSKRIVTAKHPKLLKGVGHYGTMIVVSDYEAPKSSGIPIARKVKKWSKVYAGWKTKVTLPKLSLKKGKSYSVDVLYLGAPKKIKNTGNTQWSKITHVSKNSTVFKY